MKRTSEGASAPVFRNGFPVLTRLDLQAHFCIAMDSVESMGALFAAIKRLAADSPEIKGLAKHGKDLADILHNDIDVAREEAEKAGIEGYMAPEVRND